MLIVDLMMNILYLYNFNILYCFHIILLVSDGYPSSKSHPATHNYGKVIFSLKIKNIIPTMQMILWY